MSIDTVDERTLFFDCVAATTTARDVALIDKDGGVLARAFRDPEIEDVDALRGAVLDVFRNHPRPGLSRVVTMDDAGPVVGQSLGAAMLVLAFTQETAVGVALHAVGKLQAETQREGMTR